MFYKPVSLLVLQYDNVLMEESAQILEIETFIPLLLQVSCTRIIAWMFGASIVLVTLELVFSLV